MTTDILKETSFDVTLDNRSVQITPHNLKPGHTLHVSRKKEGNILILSLASYAPREAANHPGTRRIPVPKGTRSVQVFGPRSNRPIATFDIPA